jgi:hypothetical protein
MIERVMKRLCGLIEIAPATVHQIEVHPAVIVIIEEGTAGSNGLG